MLENGGCALLLIMLATLIFPSSSARSATSSASEADIKAEEQELGVAIYANLKAQRVIIESSPLYDVLNPISTEIVRVAQPRYHLPMTALDWTISAAWVSREHGSQRLSTAKLPPRRKP